MIIPRKNLTPRQIRMFKIIQEWNYKWIDKEGLEDNLERLFTDKRFKKLNEL